MIWWLVACTQQAPGRCEAVDEAVEVALTTTDYSVGALAGVHEDLEVTDTLSISGADAVLRVLGDELGVLERGSGDALRLYAADQLGCAPRLEIPLPASSNPHDAVLFDGKAWVALYGSDEIWVLDLDTGRLDRTVSLAEHADADGLPEVHQLVEIESELFAVLHRFERPNWEASDGVLVQVSGDRGAALRRLGPSPTLSPSDEGYLVRTGVYWSLDGALSELDGDRSLLESDLGYDLAGVASVGEHSLVIGVDFDGTTHLHCWDRSTDAYEDLDFATASFLSEAQPVGDEVWVALRKNFLTEGEGQVGVLRIDPRTCEILGDPLDFLLDPYSLAVLP